MVTITLDSVDLVHDLPNGLSVLQGKFNLPSVYILFEILQRIRPLNTLPDIALGVWTYQESGRVGDMATSSP